MAITVYLLNHFFTKVVQGKAPYEAWYRRKPDVSYLKIFGYVAYAHVPTEKRSKLDDKSIKCIFVGYGNETKGCRLYDLVTKKLFISCDVIFNEIEASRVGLFTVKFEKRFISKAQTFSQRPTLSLIWLESPLSGTSVAVTGCESVMKQGDPGLTL